MSLISTKLLSRCSLLTRSLPLGRPLQRIVISPRRGNVFNVSIATLADTVNLVLALLF